MGQRFFSQLNWTSNLALGIGHQLPLWDEFVRGGTSMRGLSFGALRGDTLAHARTELSQRLWARQVLELRVAAFADAAAMFFRDADASRKDGRRFLDAGYFQDGFRASRDVHATAGSALRVHFGSFRMPLLEIAGTYAFRPQLWRLLLLLNVV